MPINYLDELGLNENLSIPPAGDVGSRLALEEFARAQSKISSISVTTGDIADDAITNAKVANNAVNTAEIVAAAVTSPKLGLTSGTAAGTTDISTNSTTFVDMTDMSVTLTTGSGIVLISFFAAVTKTTLGSVLTQVLEDSTVIGATVDTIGDTYLATPSLAIIRTPASAASHTYKVQWKVTGGSVAQTGTSYTRQLAVVCLG